MHRPVQPRTILKLQEPSATVWTLTSMHSSSRRTTTATTTLTSTLYAVSHCHSQRHRRCCNSYLLSESLMYVWGLPHCTTLCSSFSPLWTFSLLFQLCGSCDKHNPMAVQSKEHRLSEFCVYSYRLNKIQRHICSYIGHYKHCSYALIL